MRINVSRSLSPLSLSLPLSLPPSLSQQYFLKKAIGIHLAPHMPVQALFLERTLIMMFSGCTCFLSPTSPPSHPSPSRPSPGLSASSSHPSTLASDGGAVPPSTHSAGRGTERLVAAAARAVRRQVPRSMGGRKLATSTERAGACES